MIISEEDTALRWVSYLDIENGTMLIRRSILQPAAGAFQDCRGLTGFHVPKGIIQIGAGAFDDCSNLRQIHLPQGITQIGAGAFDGCSSLREIHLPEGVAQINMGAFRNCSSLNEIHLPKGITHIEHYTFYGCSSLRKIHLPKDITWIGYDAFYMCISLTHIIINSDDEEEIARIKSLLLKHLRQKVVSKADYDKASQKIESALARLERPELNPLYPFMVNESLSLFPDVLTVIGGFERESSQYYQSAKQAMEALPIPKNDGQMQAYQEKIDDIVEQYLNEAEEDARKQVEHRYQQSLRRYPEQTKNLSPAAVKKFQERKYPLLSEEELGNHLDAFNRFHRCCAELSKKHSDFVTRDKKAASRETRELLNTLQLAYINYMKDSRKLLEESNKLGEGTAKLKKKSELSERAKAFRQTCQDAIDKATPELEKHRGLKEILTNLAIALVTLGVAFLVNYAITGRFFFHPATASQKILNKTCKTIEEIDFPGLEQEQTTECDLLALA
ncbi:MULTISPECIES: leucine-rich repeat domain-containing protein [Legionella]|uniref:Leucine-rich repeat domain-containing protein n=1 Tax=Legionella septentrionalis TaxID=2498109 RepID=A0A433JJB8_9GAMM|nr:MULTISPECIES: leucine-rich repeat domain-containing protein [Legionella]MCP0913707.1 leucine-rich repeat domain-containing protein [Legionella sp. 27cVA30]RUQ88239.1 leucine-rich repeat domain-containing protein [Legionella septentrionalis]RUQ97481.1 leucine-rich repeat domain-containing protein [Legionella septentrionalis]RUR09777.1 leucine-rich repeat domain-containing protein [Legionella septentrionalis]RUR15931.1 leucine-rich repeat domain-containing protein [Legionella septentrionalis]